MPILPYMNILTPTPSVTPGPQWSQELNTALSIVDSHNHTSGQGLPIPSSGLNINQNLSFGTNYVTSLGAARLVDNVVALADPLDITTIYAAAGELWYNDANGAQVQITSGGSLNASSLGAIGGDYGASTALLAFYNVNETFVFTKDTNEAAPIDCGPVAIRDIAASANKITLKSPSGLVANYDITLPAALPSAGKQIPQINNTGVTTFGPTLPVSGTKLVAIDNVGDLTTTLTISAGSITDLVNLTMTGAIATPISITLDNGATDGGSINFNGGSSSFIKSNAAGTELTIAGFTDAVVPVGVANDIRNTTTVSSGTALGNLSVSSSSGTFSTSSLSYVDVTNLSVTLTTRGNHVEVWLGSDGSAAASFVGGGNFTAGSTVLIAFTDASNNILQQYNIQMEDISTNNGRIWIPSSAIRGTFLPAAGSNTFKCRICVGAGTTGLAYVYYCNMYAREMF